MSNLIDNIHNRACYSTSGINMVVTWAIGSMDVVESWQRDVYSMAVTWATGESNSDKTW